MPKLVKESIVDLELDLALKRAVYNKFPDATVTKGIYYSKLVNRVYNKHNFNASDRWLSLSLRYEMEVAHNGKTYIVDVLGTANQSYQIATTESSNFPISYQHDTVRFQDYVKDFKKHKVRDDILNEVRVEALKFIKAHPKYKLDDRNLEPRLKNLLIFN